MDVVAVTRGVLGIRRVGHGGTLDPLATGLLPILVGDTTRSFDRLHAASKVYAAWVRFGAETATDDAGGSITREAERPARSQVEDALSSFRGVIKQRPPAYAAVKVDGRRAYDRARAGEQVELAEREVHVSRIDMARWDAVGDLALLVVCSAGTYIRSIARDLGQAVGSAAHLARLRRLAVGALDVADAITIDALRAAGRDAALARIVAFDDDTLTLPARYLSETADRLVPTEGSA